MKAVIARAKGGPETLELVELATPAPGPGEALVRVEAAGVNFIDVYQRTGLYELPRPLRLGLEGAGVVEEVGPGVLEVEAGERVAWANAQGSYASHVLVAASRLVPVPDAIATDTAAAAMLQGMTAHYLVRSTYALGPTDTCVIHAAAGGVGLLLCQLAKRAGARAIGVVSTEPKAERARRAGAEPVIVTNEARFAEEVRRLTGGRGATVVYDSVGKDTYLASFECLCPRGMLVLYGQSSGAVPPIDPLLLSSKGSLFLTRPVLGHYTATREELVGRAEDVLSLVSRGELEVAVHAVLPLADAARAHRLLEGRQTMGKLLLRP